MKGREGFDGDSISIITSCGKPIASILMAIMKQKGLLNFEEKVSNYWPEFAKNGK